MTQHILLERFRTLLNNQPALEGRGAYGPAQHAWLGKVSALFADWDKSESLKIKAYITGLSSNVNRPACYGVVMTAMHSAIAALESSLPQTEPRQVFGPGAAYDFFMALSQVVSSATTDLFVIDPYMDTEVFDGYLSGLPSAIEIRLLSAKYADSIRVAAAKFRAQYSCSLDARVSTALHDRVIFVDKSHCWLLGSSIKDAAAKKPTYLAPLSADMVAEKLAFYEAIWASATAI